PPPQCCPEALALLRVRSLRRPPRRIQFECPPLGICGAVVHSSLRRPATPFVRCARARHVRTEWQLRVEIFQHARAGKLRPNDVLPLRSSEATTSWGLVRTEEHSALWRPFVHRGAPHNTA